MYSTPGPNDTDPITFTQFTNTNTYPNQRISFQGQCNLIDGIYLWILYQLPDGSPRMTDGYHRIIYSSDLERVIIKYFKQNPNGPFFIPAYSSFDDMIYNARQIAQPDTNEPTIEIIREETNAIITKYRYLIDIEERIEKERLERIKKERLEKERIEIEEILERQRIEREERLERERIERIEREKIEEKAKKIIHLVIYKATKAIQESKAIQRNAEATETIAINAEKEIISKQRGSAYSVKKDVQKATTALADAKKALKTITTLVNNVYTADQQFKIASIQYKPAEGQVEIMLSARLITNKVAQIVKLKLESITKMVKKAEAVAISREEIDKAADVADAALKQVLIQLNTAEDSALVATNTLLSIKTIALDAKNSNQDAEVAEVAAAKAEAIAAEIRTLTKATTNAANKAISAAAFASKLIMKARDAAIEAEQISNSDNGTIQAKSAAKEASTKLTIVEATATRATGAKEDAIKYETDMKNEALRKRYKANTIKKLTEEQLKESTKRVSESEKAINSEEASDKRRARAEAIAAEIRTLTKATTYAADKPISAAAFASELIMKARDAAAEKKAIEKANEQTTTKRFWLF
jgi:hypothetical protein